MTPKEVGELLKLIAEHAPRLREAGISGAVSVGAITFTVGPGPGSAPVGDDKSDDDDEPGGDVLRDPWTHGRPGRDAPKSLSVSRRKL